MLNKLCCNKRDAPGIKNSKQYVTGIIRVERKEKERETEGQIKRGRERECVSQVGNRKLPFSGLKMLQFML